MDTSVDAAIGGRGGIGSLERIGRFVLIAYLSPVILVVLAIGLVGMVATKIGKPTAMGALKGASVTVKGVHSAHETNRPVGLAKSVAQVRKVV
jgi:hypothetical protein